MVVYEDILYPVRKAGSKSVQGCTTNAKVVFEARENFMVYCVKSCRKIQKQEHRNFAIIEGSEKIVEYAEKNSLKLLSQNTLIQFKIAGLRPFKFCLFILNILVS